MKRVAITGPESSGKTTLARALADGAPSAAWVPEYARAFLEARGGDYQEADLVTIARGQVEAVAQAAKARPALLISDTDLVVVRIWSLERFGRVAPAIDRMLREATWDLTLLLTPDLPWAPDPLRVNPRDRDRLFDRYQAELHRLGRPFVVIAGDDRLASAQRAIADLTGRKPGPGTATAPTDCPRGPPMKCPGA